MNRRGFSLLEVLVALAILVLLSVSLAPLMIRLTEADHRARTQDAAWRKIQSDLTAFYLDDVRFGREPDPEFEINWELASTTGSVSWSRLTVTPKQGEKPAATVFVERHAGAPHSIPERPGPP